jgi:hypothetical protein
MQALHPSHLPGFFESVLDPSSPEAESWTDVTTCIRAASTDRKGSRYRIRQHKAKPNQEAEDWGEIWCDESRA